MPMFSDFSDREGDEECRTCDGTGEITVDRAMELDLYAYEEIGHKNDWELVKCPDCST